MSKRESVTAKLLAAKWFIFRCRHQQAEIGESVLYEWKSSASRPDVIKRARAGARASAVCPANAGFGLSWMGVLCREDAWRLCSGTYEQSEEPTGECGMTFTARAQA